MSARCSTNGEVMVNETIRPEANDPDPDATGSQRDIAKAIAMRIIETGVTDLLSVYQACRLAAKYGDS